jgi:restriction system protein
MFRSLRGWFGEKLTTFGMWLRLDETIYHRIDDIIVPSTNGTTQIDHVLVSVYGIFVIETKNMQGWIFGGESDSTWCQSIYGHTKRFQNPLRQNYRHVECLAEFLGVDRTLLRSVVFFIGECEFKTPMPSNVLCSGLSRYVETFHTSVLGQQQVVAIQRQLRDLKASSGLTKSDHLASLDRRHSSETTCPKCGGNLVQRTTKQSGKQFLGCSNFPKCRHTVWPK